MSGMDMLPDPRPLWRKQIEELQASIEQIDKLFGKSSAAPAVTMNPAIMSLRETIVAIVRAEGGTTGMTTNEIKGQLFKYGHKSEPERDTVYKLAVDLTTKKTFAKETRGGQTYFKSI